MPHQIAKFLLKPLLLLARAYIWIVFKTSHLEVRVDNDSEQLLKGHKPLILALWHNRSLLSPCFFKRFGRFTAVVSAHKDGSFLEEFLNIYGHGAIRGSSRKQGFNAIKQAIGHLRQGKMVVITPDGPLGPCYSINGNIVKLAAKIKVPIIPASYSAKRAKILSTWDKFIVPYPFNKIIFEISKPFLIDNTLNEQQTKIELQQLMINQACKLDGAIGLNNV